MTDLPSARPLRVLVVDDYPDAAESLRVLLSLWGHAVGAVRDGRAALETAESLKPDVVLLDVQMPGLHGAEVARRLRRLPGLEGVLLVATSATDPHDPRLADYAGVFDAYLPKPYPLDQLEALLAGRAAHANC
jgi:two-component system, chemotaxis family, CheB/CheR fusion protein